LGVWVILRFLAGLLSAWALISSGAWSLNFLARAGREDLDGIVFAGVGIGIAVVGLFCVAAAQPGVSSNRLWLELGALGALMAAIPGVLLGRASEAADAPALPARAEKPERCTGLIVCYGVLGFGYILPATFLTALASQVVDDPRIFSLAWPVFGIAAALSTVVAAWHFARSSRLRVWAAGHLAMAVGVVLPSLWLSPATVVIAALLVGSTFMVVTMIGMQEAHARAPGDATALLGLMTAAFAVGQLGGPTLSGVLDLLPGGHGAALGRALQLAAAALTLSAAYLWHRSRAIPK
jgi:hypothetical protein